MRCLLAKHPHDVTVEGSSLPPSRLSATNKEKRLFLILRELRIIRIPTSSARAGVLLSAAKKIPPVTFLWLSVFLISGCASTRGVMFYCLLHSIHLGLGLGLPRLL